MNSNERALIDEYGELTRRVDEFRTVVARQKAVKDLITAWCENSPDEPHEYDGGMYRVQLGPKALQRTIPSMRRIYRALGVARFLEWCTFPLTALDKLIADQEGYVEESHSGPRSIKVVLLKPASDAKQKRAA